jgi:hypothetical protein
MSAVQPIVKRIPSFEDGSEPIESTLLDLVRSVAEVTADDREVVATVRHMILSGRVRLCGIFRHSTHSDF